MFFSKSIFLTTMRKTGHTRHAAVYWTRAPKSEVNNEHVISSQLDFSLTLHWRFSNFHSTALQFQDFRQGILCIVCTCRLHMWNKMLQTFAEVFANFCQFCPLAYVTSCVIITPMQATDATLKTICLWRCKFAKDFCKFFCKLLFFTLVAI